MKIYWIKEYSNRARLGMMARPRGGDWLEDDIVHLKKVAVSQLVSLLTKEEIAEFDLKEEGKLCQKHGLVFMNLPIEDMSLPSSDQKVDSLLDTLVSAIDKGQSIVVHCRAGIGRSSLIVAGILIKQGVHASTAIQEISKGRGRPVPETEEQAKWIKGRR